ncbi:YhcN/YlaJ family sporulation lipoprotein [Oceanobacillus manasiensis]|uniref:YhcN/YlaJ family sporulation lipoprotein n=1 Tax=Oceanobacillus manasiensis TaxID=586413 RepID=UPI0005A98E62|nr:YhcN/YlaJ family sporulation lipoprotein [Oceanobacillus manasiensis]
MKRKVIVGLILTILTGCNLGMEEQGQQRNDQQNTEYVHYETEKERKEQGEGPSIGERGGYPQSQQEGANDADFKRGYSDQYTNEEALWLSEELENRKDIVTAQVASTEDQILVGLVQREYAGEDVPQQVKKEIQRLLPDNKKEIIVFTDNAYWEYMKNRDAKPDGNTP